jgi:hypothetical protein
VAGTADHWPSPSYYSYDSRWPADGVASGKEERGGWAVLDTTPLLLHHTSSRTKNYVGVVVDLVLLLLLSFLLYSFHLLFLNFFLLNSWLQVVFVLVPAADTRQRRKEREEGGKSHCLLHSNQLPPIELASLFVLHFQWKRKGGGGRKSKWKGKEKQ